MSPTTSNEQAGTGLRNGVSSPGNAVSAPGVTHDTTFGSHGSSQDAKRAATRVAFALEAWISDNVT
jgi:hypothetical protein